MHAEILPSLVLIAQAIFLLEHGYTDTQTNKYKVTDAADHCTHASTTPTSVTNIRSI